MAQNDSFKGTGRSTIDTPVGAQWPNTATNSPGNTEFGRATAAGGLEVTAAGDTPGTTPFRTEATTGQSDRYERTGREVVVAERERTRPSATKVIGAALAGAVAGSAIPFMLAGRKQGERTVSQHQQSEPFVSQEPFAGRSKGWRDNWR